MGEGGGAKPILFPWVKQSIQTGAQIICINQLVAKCMSSVSIVCHFENAISLIKLIVIGTLLLIMDWLTLKKGFV